jgi:hypothetical protein
MWDAAMRRGDWPTAWRISDAILAARDSSRRDDPRLPYHLRWVWDGRSFDGRNVLVRCYHGLGDTLQFVRYLPALRSRSASVSLEAQPELLPLFADLPGADRVIPFAPAAPAPPSECDIEVMELPHALRLGPVPSLRLSVRPIAVSPAIALCWAVGNWDPARAIPLQPLLAAIGPMRVISLQRGPAACEATDQRFLNPDDRSTDILRSAALAAGAALVVTIDTMVVHLAGALGLPTLLLLRRHADWRWMDDRTDTPWYPSVRLLRQVRDGEWDVPLSALAARIRAAN